MSTSVKRQIKAHLASKEYAEALDLCLKALDTNPKDIQLLLGAASAFYCVGDHSNSTNYCERVLSIEPQNLFALSGIITSAEKAKNFSKYDSVLGRVLEICLNSSYPERHWEFVKKALEVYKKNFKFKEAISLLSSLLYDAKVQELYSKGPQFKAKPKRISLLKDLEALYEAKDQSQIKIKSKVLETKQNHSFPHPPMCKNLQENIQLVALGKEILNELHSEKATAIVVRIAMQKLILRTFSLFQIDPKKSLFQELKSLIGQIDCKREAPFDEIYFECFFEELAPTFSHVSKAVESFYDQVPASNKSALMALYQIDTLIKKNAFSEAFGLIKTAKERKSPFLIRKQKEYLSFYEAIIAFHLGMHRESLEILQSHLNEIGTDESLLQILIASLNQEGKFEEAIEICDRFPDSQSFTLEKAWQLFCLERYSEALEIFEASNFSSKDETLLYRLGRIHLALGDKELTVDLFEKSVSVGNKSFFLPWTWLGIVLNSQEKLSTSISINIKDNALAVEKLAEIYIRSHKHFEARELLKEFISFNPKSAFALKFLAICNYKLQAWNDCISNLQLYLRINFREAEVWEILGEAYYREGRYTASLKAFQRTIEIQPASTTAKLFIGLIQDRIGKYSEAIAILKPLVSEECIRIPALKAYLDASVDLFCAKVNASCFGIAFESLLEAVSTAKASKIEEYFVWRFFAFVRYQQQRAFPSFKFESSELDIPSFEESISKAISACKVTKIRAALHLDLALYTGEKENFLEAIRLDSSNDSYWYALGHYYLKHEKLSLSQQCFTTILARSPKYFPAWNALGFLAFKQHKLELAAKAFSEAQRISPLDPISWTGLWMLDGNNENLIHAIELQEEYNSELSFLAGMHYSSSKQSHLANAAFQQFLQAFPKSAECLNYLGLIAESRGHLEIAFEYLSQVKQEFPLNYARICYSLGHFDECLEFCSSDKPSLHERIVKGLALFATGNSTSSLQTFSQCYAESKELTELQQLFVKVLYSTGKLELASRQANSLLAATSFTSPALNAMALLLAWKEQNSTHLESILSNSHVPLPQFGKYAEFLVQFHCGRGAKDLARKVAYQALLIDSSNEALWRFISPPKTIRMQDLIYDKYNLSNWKSLVKQSAYEPKVISSLAKLDPKLGESIAAELESNSPFFDSHPSDLSTRILFRSFWQETVERCQSSSNFPLLLQELHLETVIEVLHCLWKHGIILNKALWESIPVPTPYTALWTAQSQPEHSIKAISTWAKKNGGHSQATLMLQTIISHFYLKAPIEASLKIANKILAVESGDEATGSIVQLINQSTLVHG